MFIHSVDAQSSAAGGIIIQVIGEMSNAGEAWRKFAQTFFLAEQPNGYFVLNDIFRYLKEESNADDEAEEEAEATPNGTEAVAPEPVHAPQLHDVPEVAPVPSEPEPVAAPAPAVPEPPTAEVAPEEPAVNGTHVEEKPDTPEPAKETTQLPSPSPEPEQPAEEPTPAELTPARGSTPAPAAPASAPAAPPSAAPAEKSHPPAAAPSAPPAASQPAAPPVPAAPKTWANLAAANSSKWGQVSADARGVSTPVKPSGPPAKPAPAAPARKEEPPVDTSNLSPQAQAAMSVNTAQCFIKVR